MRPLSLLLLLLLQFPVYATSSLNDIEQLLAKDEAPTGVVFEILAAEQGLRWAIPQIVRHSERLRSRFPGISIAVVSHGREEFALQRSKQGEFAEVHQAVRQLSQVEDIPVHVCGTHASWYDVRQEDFPDYVDVAPSGPAQIHAYQELGYHLIRLSREP